MGCTEAVERRRISAYRILPCWLIDLIYEIEDLLIISASLARQGLYVGAVFY